MRHTLTLAALAFGTLVVVTVLGTQLGAEIYTNVTCALFDGESAGLGGCGHGPTNWTSAVRFGVLVGAIAAGMVVALWAAIRRAMTKRPSTQALTLEVD